MAFPANPVPGGHPPHGDLRELLFADLPPDRAREVFARGGDATAFIVALADAALAHDRRAAEAALGRVPDATRESRLVLQAWSLARAAGVDPSTGAGEVLGVVVDMHLEEGLDTLAGFADGSARYLNHSGAAIVWEVADDAVGARVHDLVEAATAVVPVTGPLDGPRPDPPGMGGAMISVLTRGGIHVGAGSVHALSRDSRGGPVIAAAAAVLALLVERATTNRGAG